ncbi:arsenate reductase ArsC [Hafnia paralvei]|uniref:arsenate reductase ArsC n=1 Tax=Hafnia paralvei TaxID=546367 RepID=UPI00103324F8|nr:arsenate reductase ArsC [Hafnia paralvei]TBM07103.1 arsenate reductase ArsC [Hafnia paralvei]
MNILFLCTGNSCRSILAEATFNALSPKEHHAFSAGSQPKGEVHPRSLALLRIKEIPTDGYYSKSWDNLPVTPDVVITVCGNAAGETCPAYLAPAVRAHWGVEDPDKATGSEQEIDAAFEKAWQILHHRIEAFLSLPSSVISGPEERLQADLNRIGETIF